MTAVWGIEAAISASFAWGVPATEARISAAWLLEGMRRKSAGKSVLAA
jgi:hypothetical protein